jgi:nucleoside phosphorylase
MDVCKGVFYVCVILFVGGGGGLATGYRPTDFVQNKKLKKQLISARALEP